MMDSSGRTRRRSEAIEQLAGSRYLEPTVLHLDGPCIEIDAGRIEVTEVDATADVRPDASRERHGDARRLDPGLRVVGAEPFDVRRMRQDAARIPTEATPLLHEVVTAVIADLL